MDHAVTMGIDIAHRIVVGPEKSSLERLLTSTHTYDA
jgi:hypothetical protein